MEKWFTTYFEFKKCFLIIVKEILFLSKMKYTFKHLNLILKKL